MSFWYFFAGFAIGIPLGMGIYYLIMLKLIEQELIAFRDNTSRYWETGPGLRRFKEG